MDLHEQLATCVLLSKTYVDRTVDELTCTKPKRCQATNDLNIGIGEMDCGNIVGAMSADESALQTHEHGGTLAGVWYARAATVWSLCNGRRPAEPCQGPSAATSLSHR